MKWGMEGKLEKAGGDWTTGQLRRIVLSGGFMPPSGGSTPGISKACQPHNSAQGWLRTFHSGHRPGAWLPTRPAQLGIYDLNSARLLFLELLLSFFIHGRNGGHRSECPDALTFPDALSLWVQLALVVVGPVTSGEACDTIIFVPRVFMELLLCVRHRRSLRGESQLGTSKPSSLSWG